MTPVLTTYFGNDDLEDSYGLSGEDMAFLNRAGVKTARILHRWPKLTVRQKALMYKRYPELMGFIPIPLIAAIGKGVVTIGKKVVSAVKKKQDQKKAAKAAQEQAIRDKAAQEQAIKEKAAQEELIFQRQLKLQQAQRKNDQSKMLLTLLPVIVIGAIALMKRK